MRKAFPIIEIYICLACLMFAKEEALNRNQAKQIQILEEQNQELKDKIADLEEKLSKKYHLEKLNLLNVKHYLALTKLENTQKYYEESIKKITK